MLFSFETYECSRDDKGRVLVPAKFRKENDALIEQGFVIKRSIYFPCLELYPKSEWDKQMEKLNRLNPFSKKSLEFKQAYTSGSRSIAIDNANRILIPKDLLIATSIGKSIVMNSLGDRYQIWDKDAYDKHIGTISENFDENYQDVIFQLDEINKL